MSAGTKLALRDFFADAKWMCFHLPICPYVQYESPSTGLRLVGVQLLFWVELASLVLIFLGELWFIWDLFHSAEATANTSVWATAFAWVALTVIGFESTVMLYRNSHRIAQLLRKLDSLFPTMDQEVAHEQFQHWQLIFRLYNWVYGGTIFIMIIMPLTVPAVRYLLTGYWNFELYLYIRYPFDKYAVPWVMVAYVWEVWVILGSTCIFSVVMVLVGAMTMQMCLQYKLLANEFKKIKFCAGNYEGDRLRLIQLMDKHRELIDIGQKMNDVFTFSLLVNYLLSSIIICLFCFLIATAHDSFMGTLMFIEITSFICYTTLLSYFGQLVIDTVSLKLSDNQLK